MIYKLLQPDHPMVKTPMPEYVDSDTSDTSRKEIAESLVETMKHFGGIGLSANQVGLPYRVFVMGDNEHYINCFNPKIVVESENVVTIEEGCLTYPGLFVKIRRPDWIEVEFEDENGEKHSDTFVWSGSLQEDTVLLFLPLYQYHATNFCKCQDKKYLP